MAQGEPVYRVALFDGPRDERPKPVEVVWDELIVELSEFRVTDCKELTDAGPTHQTCIGHQCPHKKIEAWSPADYSDDCEARADAAVRGLTLAVYDLDGPPLEALAEIAEALEGIRYACHATHTAGSYRIVIPLSRAIAPADWPRVWQTIRSHYHMGASDPACANPSRIYFFPSKPWGRGPGEFYSGEGAPLGVDWLLRLYEAAPATTPKAAAVQAKANPVPLPPPEIGVSVDLTQIRKDLGRLSRPESAEIARKILAVEALALQGERDTTVNAAASILATCANPPPPADLAVEILKPSISLMPLEPEGLDYWLDKARYSYVRALNRRAANDARQDRLRESLGRGLRRAAGAPEPAEGDAVDTPPDDSEDDTPEGEPERWQEALLFTKAEDPEKSDKIRQCGANANLILTHSKQWKKFLAFNEITKDIDVLGGPALHMPKGSLDVEVANWLARSEYQLILKPQEVGPQLLAVARRHPINPLRDYLKACKAKWEVEKKVRLENFFHEFLGARGDDRYIREISRRWLISCAARALQPGCFVKTVLVLEGPQGAYKSSLLRVLGGEFFSDTKIDINTKDGRMAASRFWIIEMAELAGFRKADVEDLKNFVSNTSDDIRLPYGKVLETFPRCCVLVGTTNSDDYLTDHTGNTRYWPVKVGRVDLEGIRAVRDLLWGEATAAFDDGERWWFEPEETDMLQLAEKAVQERTRQSSRAEPILQWFLSMPPDRRPETSSTNDIASRALLLTPDRVNDGILREVGIAMHQLGFKKVRRRVDTLPVWRYELPDYMRTLAQEAKPKAAHLQMVSRIVSNQVMDGKREIKLPEIK